MQASTLETNTLVDEALTPSAGIPTEEHAADFNQMIDDLKTEIANLRTALTELQKQQRP